MTSRSYCFTTFEVDTFAVPDVPQKIAYCIFQKERCPETQRDHIQGYVELKNPMRIAGVKTLFNDKTMHLEKRNGTRTEAREYCRKPESRIDGPWEYGTWKEEAGQGKRSDLSEIYQDIKSGMAKCDILEKYPATYIRCHNGINKAIFEVNTKKCSTIFRLKIKVIVLFGETGTGKTRRAFSKDPNLFKLDKSSSGDTIWFDGYEGQKTLLIDDFYGWIPWGSMLNYLDVYPVRLPVKGTHTFAGWNRIYITSNKPWNEWYKTIEDQSAMERRIHKIVKFENISVNGNITTSCDILKNNKSYKTNGDIPAEIIPAEIIDPLSAQ